MSGPVRTVTGVMAVVVLAALLIGGKGRDIPPGAAQTANCEARRALRGRAARRSPVSLDYNVIATARFSISEFLCARLPPCLNGAAAPGPPAMLRVRLLGRPQRHSGRPNAGPGYHRARCAGPPSGRERAQRRG